MSALTVSQHVFRALGVIWASCLPCRLALMSRAMKLDFALTLSFCSTLLIVSFWGSGFYCQWCHSVRRAYKHFEILKWAWLDVLFILPVINFIWLKQCHVNTILTTDLDYAIVGPFKTWACFHFRVSPWLPQTGLTTRGPPHVVDAHVPKISTLWLGNAKSPFADPGEEAEPNL